MTPSELVGKRVDLTTTTDEAYNGHTVVDTNNPLFIVLKNRAGTVIFVAWNVIAEICYVPEGSRKPRSPKAKASSGTPEEKPDGDTKVH